MYEIIIAEVFLFVAGVYGIYTLNRYVLDAKIRQDSAKLKSQIANFKRDFPDFEEKSSKIVGDALGEIGIDGIMDQLGIDPSILKNPLVKGLVDKYAPRLIETLNKQQKTNEVSTNGFL